MSTSSSHLNLKDQICIDKRKNALKKIIFVWIRGMVREGEGQRDDGKRLWCWTLWTGAVALNIIQPSYP